MIRPHLDRVNSSVERPWQGSLQTFEVAVRRCARQNRDSLDCQFVVVVVDGFLPRFWLFFFLADQLDMQFHATDGLPRRLR